MDIDEDEGVIHIRRQIKKLGKSYVFALPQSDRTRKVPLPPSIAAACGRTPRGSRPSL